MKANKKTGLLFLAIVAVAVIGLRSSVVYGVAAEYSKSYKSNQSLTFGTLVSIVDGSSDTIQPTTLANSKNFLGVYVGEQGSTIALNKQQDSAQVAISGDTIALVSNENGDIHKGDKLAVSRIDGVASKARENIAVVGIALADFDENESKNTKLNITLADGASKDVTIGPVEMEIYTLKKDSVSQPGLVGWIERVTGKEVTPLKMIIAFLITVLLIFSITIMTYSAIRNTIVQASRNPLAKPVIMQALVRIFMFIAIISIIGVGLIYLVLKA